MVGPRPPPNLILQALRVMIQSPLRRRGRYTMSHHQYFTRVVVDNGTISDGQRQLNPHKLSDGHGSFYIEITESPKNQKVKSTLYINEIDH